MTSQARIDANRKNAQKSTGPTTDAGRQRVRLNALKHGLRSEEVVLPTEDRAAFESHMTAWMDDWKPPTETRRFLVERAATAAWRIKRCVRSETDRLANRAFKGYAEWDTVRQTAIARAVQTMSDQPVESVAALMANRSGINALMMLWNGLVDALKNPEGWSDMEEQHNMFCDLLGINGHDDPEHLRQTSLASYRLLLRVRTDLADEDLTPLDDAMAGDVRQMLRKICSAKQDEILERWDCLPDETVSRNRHAERKAFEPHPEDAIYGRYEGRLDREARAAIAQLIKLEQTGADLIGLDETEAPNEPKAVEPEPLLSAQAPNEPNTDQAKSAESAEAPNEPNATPPIVSIVKADRDRGCRSWTLATDSTMVDDGPTLS